MKYAKITKGVVSSIHLHPTPGLVEVADSVYCGMTQNQNGTFSNPVPTQEQLMERVRFDRNQLLAQSDWMANSDVAMSPEWETYRQALRDITKQTPTLDADGNLTGITWPTPPTD